MNRIVVRSALGFALGLLTTALLSALTVFLAINGEETVALGPVATTEYTAIDSVEFQIEFFVGWLGYALPALGLLLGGVLGALGGPQSEASSVG